MRIPASLRERIHSLDVNKLPGAVVLMIFTVIITSVVQLGVTLYISNTTYEENIRQVKIELISDIVEQSTHIELLRDKCYWNKFFCDVHILVEGSTVSVDEYASKEDEYRSEYERMVSEFTATLLKSKIYFSSDEMCNSVSLALGEGFEYDSDAIGVKYNELLVSALSAEDQLTALTEYAETLYNEDFLALATTYAYELSSELK